MIFKMYLLLTLHFFRKRSTLFWYLNIQNEQAYRSFNLCLGIYGICQKKIPKRQKWFLKNYLTKLVKYCIQTINILNLKLFWGRQSDTHIYTFIYVLYVFVTLASPTTPYLRLRWKKRLSRPPLWSDQKKLHSQPFLHQLSSINLIFYCRQFIPFKGTKSW